MAPQQIVHEVESCLLKAPYRVGPPLRSPPHFTGGAPPVSQAP